MRRALMGGDPFRCRACGWRGWIDRGPLEIPGSERRSKAPRMDRTTALGMALVAALFVFVVGTMYVLGNIRTAPASRAGGGNITIRSN